MLYRRGQMWWYKFRFAGQLFQESARTRSKPIARDAERARRRRLEEGLNGIRRREKPLLFWVAAEAWLESKRATLAPKSVQIEKTNLKHLRPALGNLLLTDIRPEDFSEYQKERTAAGASPKTVNLEVGTARAILRRHGLWAALQPHTRMLTVNDDVGVCLTPSQETSLLDACRSSRSRALFPCVLLALNTGLRRGELLSIRWDQVDFIRRTVRVGKSKTANGSGRVVFLNESAMRVLSQLRATTSYQPLHYVFAAERYGFGGSLRSVTTHSIDPEKPLRSLKEAWETAKAISGVTCRFHDLRHTCCTRMLEAGVPLSVLASVMGWSTGTAVRMSRRYGHIGDDSRRQAMAALESFGQHHPVSTARSA